MHTLPWAGQDDHYSFLYMKTLEEKGSLEWEDARGIFE